MGRGDLWWGREVGGTASRCSGCLEARNPRWTLDGGRKSLLQEPPAQGLPSTCSPVPGLSTGGQTVQEEEDKMPGPQRAGWHAWVSAGLPSGRGWQTHLMRLPSSPCPCEWGRRRPGSSTKLPNCGSSPPRPSGWEWEWGLLSTSLSLHVPESLQTPSQKTEGRAGLT